MPRELPLPNIQMYFRLSEWDGRTAIPCTMEEWARTRDVPGAPSRFLRQENHGPYWISTVFVGFNHAYDPGPPEIFETMVFPRGFMGDEWCERASTYEEAMACHSKAIAWCNEQLAGMEWWRRTWLMGKRLVKESYPWQWVWNRVYRPLRTRAMMRRWQRITHEREDGVCLTDKQMAVRASVLRSCGHLPPWTQKMVMRASSRLSRILAPFQ